MAIRGERKKITGKITITRPSFCGDKEIINLTLLDSASNEEFVDIEIDLADFSKLLTGQARTPFVGEVSGLDIVGKTFVPEKRRVLCPIKSHNKDILSDWLRNEYKEEGWFVDPYLGSQGSIGTSDKDGTYVNFSVYKYVEIKEEDTE